MIVGGLFLLIVRLGLLALPFRKAPAAAESAKADLEAAKAVLDRRGLRGRRGAASRARGATPTRCRTPMQGIGGDVWSLIPVVGGPSPTYATSATRSTT